MRTSNIIPTWVTRGVAVGLIIVGGAVAAPTAATAAKPSTACGPAKANAMKDLNDQQRNEQINLAIANHLAAIQDSTGSAIGTFAQDVITSDIDAFLECSYGMVKVTPEDESTSGDVSALSTTPGHVNLPRPSIYYETANRKYMAYARWYFDNTIDARRQLYDEAGSWCYTCDIGKYDAFGFAFSRNVNSVSGYSETTWGRSSTYPASTSRMWPADANVYGVIFKGQDTVKKDGLCCFKDYDFYNGQILYTIGSIGCGTIQAFSKYGHTWDKANVSGLGVSRSSVSISFTNSSRSWDLVSQPSNSFRAC